MNKPKFSPGPWEIEHKIEEGDNIWWANTPYVEPAAAKCFNLANAQLIASAPELFEALKRAKAIINEVMSWDGELQVFGWHKNGDPISLDALIFDNISIDDLTEIDLALAKAQGLEGEG